jgi:aldehyde:ferredoxin oxidoreductase
LKQAGLDGIVLRGASEKPVYLRVKSDGIEIRDASRLWGKDTWDTSKAIGDELEDPGLKRIKVMAIGPAGENLVSFACLINEYCHAAARGGAGAVLGAKKVKAIVIDTKNRPVYVSSSFRKAAETTRRKIRNNPTCQSYSRFGSLPVSDAWLEMGCLSGKNFQTGVLPGWRETRGTGFIKSFVTRSEGSCFGCAMPCFNRVEVREGKYKGLAISSGTFVQAVIEFGAKCAIESLPAIWKCKEICHRLGMDYGSASGVTAFAMELIERGLLGPADTGGLSLTWGNEESVFHLLRQIAGREGLGDLLADGSLKAAAKIGPEAARCVMAVKGMEMISSDIRSGPRAWSLGSMTSPRGGDNVRGTHMKGEAIPSLALLKEGNASSLEAYSKGFVSGIDMFEEVKRAIYGSPPRVDPFRYDGKALMTKWFEDLFSGVNALGLCTFPADKLALGPTDYAALFSSFLGEEISPEEFMDVGQRIFNLQRLYNVREGITRKDDRWPDRFFEESVPEGPAKGAVLSKETIGKVLDEYYEARGWDRSTGIPAPETLGRLGLAGI